jgi:Ssp1 endopeptidase immunity protein Rap1a
MALLCLTALPTEAAFYNGNKLYTECTGSKATDQVSCISYIEGIADMVAGLWTPKDTACFSPGINAGQLQDIVVNYLQDHPENRHWPATILVLQALHDAFPCPRK